jgi:murein DD-endopeptidase MepM/ murein hydrolase activator NlpD
MSLFFKIWNNARRRRNITAAFVCLASLVPLTARGQSDTGSDATPEPTPTATVNEGVTVHVVQAGESLDQIARTYGVLSATVEQANGLNGMDDLTVGQRLVIPIGTSPTGSQTSIVANLNESLYILAVRYGVSVEQLGKMNRIINPTRLVAGQNLITMQDGSGYRAVVRNNGGQSWLDVAVANRLNPWALRLINAGLSVPISGDLMAILAEGTIDRSLPSPWVSVVLHPLPLERGRVGGLRVVTDQPGELSVSFMAVDWPVVSDITSHNALIAIDRLSATGIFPLTLSFVGEDGKTTELTAAVQVRGGGYDRESIVLADDVAAILTDPVAVEDELSYLRQVMTGFTPERSWDGLFRLPAAGVLTSGFGTLRSYNGSDFNTFHSGADIAGPIGTPIYAPAGGVVVDTGLLEVRGFITIIDHGWGVYTGYWHQSSILVNPGDRVTAGQQIGAIGNTGLSTASHVHWEMWVGGVQVDAMQWVREVFP